MMFTKADKQELYNIRGTLSGLRLYMTASADRLQPILKRIADRLDMLDYQQHELRQIANLKKKKKRK
jgi:hypothetical protein